MSVVVDFSFNPFQENTYLVYDETKECVIIDPGCYTALERKELDDYIVKHELKPVLLLNTHCHLDHIFGNKHVAETYGLKLEIHKGELPVLKAAPQVAAMYGVPMPDESPMPESFIDENDTIEFGNTSFEIFFTPGHSPASISFYNKKEAYIIGGDVLFLGSIGRTDLPGGNFETLIRSIKTHFLSLPAQTKVYSGHGGPTTVGFEAMNNPFLQGD